MDAASASSFADPGLAPPTPEAPAAAEATVRLPAREVLMARMERVIDDQPLVRNGVFLPLVDKAGEMITPAALGRVLRTQVDALNSRRDPVSRLAALMTAQRSADLLGAMLPANVDARATAARAMHGVSSIPADVLNAASSLWEIIGREKAFGDITGAASNADEGAIGEDEFRHAEALVELPKADALPALLTGVLNATELATIMPHLEGAAGLQRTPMGVVLWVAHASYEACKTQRKRNRPDEGGPAKAPVAIHRLQGKVPAIVLALAPRQDRTRCKAALQEVGWSKVLETPANSEGQLEFCTCGADDVRARLRRAGVKPLQ